jgi:hypothetical protein
MCYPHLLATVSRGGSFDQKYDFPFLHAQKQYKPLNFKWLRIFENIFETFFNDFFFARACNVVTCMCYPHLLATVSRGDSFDPKCDFPFLYAQKQYKPLNFKWLRIFQSLFFTKIYHFQRPRAHSQCICHPHLLATVSRGGAFKQKCDCPFYVATHARGTYCLSEHILNTYRCLSHSLRAVPNMASARHGDCVREGTDSAVSEHVWTSLWPPHPKLASASRVLVSFCECPKRFTFQK